MIEMSMELLVFAVLALLTLASSIGVVVARNPVTAAILLVMDLFFLAAIYATLGADFIAAIQIIVYAGAIVVLFLFVIMLLNLREEFPDSRGVPVPEILTAIALVVLFAVLAIRVAATHTDSGFSQVTGTYGLETIGQQTNAVGMHLFQKYLWPFELSSLLILLATIGAVVIAKKPKKDSV